MPKRNNMELMAVNILILLGLVLLVLIGFFTGLWVGIGEGLSACKKKKRKSKLPKCDCSDVNQCHKLCYAKVAFNKDFQDGKI